MQISYADLKKAAERIKPFIHRTPVVTSSAINRLAGRDVFFKCENLQKVGAFKFRGACNAVFSLTDEQASKGVVAHSSGNHAQALALAAKMRGIPAYIVMPDNAPSVKKAAVADYGGIITFCEPTLVARETTQSEIVARTGAHIVHPYDDVRIIAGQSTAALELLEDYPELDLILAPVGGGGLLSGTALAAAYASKNAKVIGAEPCNADDAFRSFNAGFIIPSQSPQTIADGLLTSLGETNFPVIREFVGAIVTVSEESIIAAMRLFWERCKLVIEPSAAVPLAAVLDGKIDHSFRKVGIIVSGGNVDLDGLPWQADVPKT
ncbi:MAG: pyridoxal-phosphate dependent enzyme [Proteobacteria bacterium]|nr:pyridoxal-phosphate dependent enzyme [Pseudomonadota bacterium]